MGLTNGISLAPLMVDIKADIKSFKDDMTKASSVGITEAKKISEELSNVTKAGEKLSGLGDKLTKGVTLPLAGAATALGKIAFDTEQDLSTLSGRLGTTAEETERLKNIAKELYNNGFGESLEDCVNDVVVLHQNIKETSDMTDEQKSKLLEQISTIKTLFGVESEELTKTLNNMLKNGIINNIDEGMDLITRGFQEGLNSGGDLLDVLYEYSPQFKKLGLNGQEALEYIKTGLDAGAYNADKMADALKELSIRAIDGSDTTKEGFELMGKSADEMARKFAAGGDTAQEALNETIEGLKNIQDPLAQDLAGVNLFGTMWEDSSKDAILAMGNVDESLTDITGATERAGEEINNSIGKQFTTSLREAKEAFLPLGIELLDLAKTSMPMIRDVIQDVSNVIKNLTDEQKESILKWGGIAMAAGPVFKLIGGGIQTFASFKSIIGGTSKALSTMEKGAGLASKLVTGLGTASSIAGGATGVGGLVTSLGGAAVAAAPFVLGAAAIGAAAYGVHKAMSQEVIPTVDLFADKIEYSSSLAVNEYGYMTNQVQANTIKISEATQTAVQAYMNMDDEVTRSLYNQKITNETITEELSQNMISKFSTMAQTIKDGQKAKYDEMTSDLTQFFSENNILTETKEAEILQKVTEKHQAQQAIVDETMNKITEIYNNAKNENRNLKQAELDEITRLQEQMRINAINSLSATEEEAAVIRQRMKDYQGRLSAEMASEMITKANETRDGEIQAANEKYEEIIRQAARLKEAGYITEEEYNSMINEADNSKNEQIKKANEACEGIKNEIANATPGIEKEVELQTGKIKTWYNRAWDSISGFFSKLFSNNSRALDEASEVNSSYNHIGGNIMGTHYNGLSYVPTDGYIARLHKGERVLTAKENKEYTQGNNSKGFIINFNGNYKFNDQSDIDYLLNRAALKLKEVR